MLTGMTPRRATEEERDPANVRSSPLQSIRSDHGSSCARTLIASDKL